MPDSLPEERVSDSNTGSRTHGGIRGRAEQVGHGMREMVRQGHRDRTRPDGSRSGPKTPMTHHRQELGRIERILTQTSTSSTEQVGSQARANRQPSRSSHMPNHQADTIEPTTAINTSHSGSLATHTDIEAQRQPTGAKKQQKWWERPRWKALRPRLWSLLLTFIFLILVLSIYLGLAFTKKPELQQEWHILLILIILVATMFFCHALIRLCIEATRPLRSTSGNLQRIPSVVGPGGYAVPRQPIRINIQNPEVVEGLKEPPPVYGLWRCSVRVSPDHFYWVRRASQGADIPEMPDLPHDGSIRERQEPNGSLERSQAPRPPSYVSEDGVSYVVNAVPEVRPDPPLPPHPSELRRHS